MFVLSIKAAADIRDPTVCEFFILAKSVNLIRTVCLALNICGSIYQCESMVGREETGNIHGHYQIFSHLGYVEY